MNALKAFDFLVYGLFWAAVLALVARILLAIYRWHTGSTQAQCRWIVPRNRLSQRLASGIVGLLLTAGCVCLGIGAAMTAWHWRTQAISVRDQKTLTLDLHIPHVIPDQTYTVVARFRIRGRPYASGPLRVRFGPQKPVYHLLLYYDPARPERNAWTRLRAGKKYPTRAAVCATGSVIFAILLIEWLKLSGISCRAFPPQSTQNSIANVKDAEN